MRDIGKYQQEYDQSPFEETMAKIRRKHVLRYLNDQKPKNVLEVGCGNYSVFNEYNCESRSIVEPNAKFLSAALTDDSKVWKCNRFLEQSMDELKGKSFDAIILSGLLHETEDPSSILGLVQQLCGSETTIHVNVPNARSLHRLLALESGLISSIYQKSETQTKLLQNHTFDMEILMELVEKSGFEVFASGSYFTKLFTHKQMQLLIENGIVDESILKGLDTLVKYIPSYGAEIYVNAKLLG